MLRPEHMNETWSPTKTGQQMMCTPASLLELEPRSLSGLVLRFYNVTDQVLNSKLSPSCSAWLWYKLKPQHAAFIYTTRITRSVVPPTETDTSQKRLLPKSPFFLPQACWRIHQPRVLFLTLQQTPAPLGHRVTKAHQATAVPSYFPPDTRPPSTRPEVARGEIYAAPEACRQFFHSG